MIVIGGGVTGLGHALLAEMRGVTYRRSLPLATGRLASVMGAIKIAHRGGQNHQPSREEIAARYQRAFGILPW